MRSFYTIANQTIEAQLLQRADTQLIFNGKAATVSCTSLGGNEYRVNANERLTSAYAISCGDRLYIHLNSRHYLVECEDETQTTAHTGPSTEKTIASAPMPGTVVSIAVEQGQMVKENDTLMVIESMKMETTISAWRDGTIASINFNVGDSFDRMAALIELDD